MEKKTKKTKKKNNKGFTLVELLAVIAILSIVASITIYISTNVLSSAKKKSYQVTITNIEKNANTYVTENNDKMFYISKDTNAEYQCLTVSNLIEMGYLDNNVIDSKVSDEDKVEPNDYVYLERNKKTKAIQKIIYDNGTYNTTCKKAVNAEGDIVFSVYPDLNKWSKTKEVIITYRVKNYENIHKYKYKYTLTDPPKNYSNASVTQPLTIDKKVTINAKILENSDTLVHKTLQISKIDNTGPTIKLTETLSGNYNGKVTIPITITDTESHVDTESVDRNDFIVTIGGVTVSASALKLTKVEEGTDEVKYELVITDSTNIGEVTIRVAPDSIFDNIENGNKDTTIPTNITMNKVYEISNSSGKVTSYQSNLTNAFNAVSDNGKIKALEHNTSSSYATNNKNNVTLDTNGKKINLKLELFNNAGKTLTITGGGSITVYGDAEIKNRGTMTTNNIIFYGASSTNFIIHNYGTYTSSSGTQITNTNQAIALYSGTVNFNDGTIDAGTYAFRHSGTWINNGLGNATLNINGGTIKSKSRGVGTDTQTKYTFTMNMNGGTITTTERSLYITTTAQIHIKGGTIQSTGGSAAVYLSASSAIMTLGTKDGNVINKPTIISKNANTIITNSIWSFYDGEIYGNNATKEYNKEPHTKENGYAVITVADKTQSGASYKSYLSPYYTVTLSAPTVTNTPTGSVKVIYNTNTLEPSSIVTPAQKYTVSGFETNATRKSDGATVSSTSTITVTNTFEGWYNSSSGGLKVLTNASTPALVTNIKDYTNANGKWIRKSNTTLYARFIDKTVKLPTISKTGYTCGWTTKATGATIEYASGANYTTKANVKLYGVCIAHKYQVAFNANGGSGSMANQTGFTYGINKVLSANTFTRTGYTFAGWKLENQGNIIADKAKVSTLTSKDNGTATLYAQWTAITSDIKLDSQGATNTPTASIKATYNSSSVNPSSITVPMKKYTVSGFNKSDTRKSSGATISSTSTLTASYAFNGWYTKASGGVQVLTKDSAVKFVASVANWTDNSKKWIKTTSATVYARYTVASVTLPTIKKTGYTCGWTTKANGTTIEYASQAKYTPTANTTMYGVCVPNTNTKYVVKHYVRNLENAQYTLNSTVEKTGTTDSSITVANLKKTITGFTYEAGYITGDTIKPTSGVVTTTTILGDGTRVINLYYRRNRLIIQYNANGGTQADTHGSKYGIDENGDFYQINSAGNKVYNFIKGVYGSNVGIINVNGDSSSAKSGLDDYNYAQTFNVEKNGYAGKAGAEWNTRADGSGSSFNQETTTYKANGFAGTSLKTGDVTIKLYVQWVEAPPGECTLVFNKNLSNAFGNLFTEPNPTTKKVNVGEKYGELATIVTTQENSPVNTTAIIGAAYTTFAGWYTGANGGKSVDSSAKCISAGTIQLYAHWVSGTAQIPNPCEINPAICNPCLANPAACNPCLASSEAAQACMEANSQAWWDAKALGDQKAMDDLHKDNEFLSAYVKEGLHYESDGYWYDGEGKLYDIHDN